MDAVNRRRQVAWLVFRRGSSGAMETVEVTGIGHQGRSPEVAWQWPMDGVDPPFLYCCFVKSRLYRLLSELRISESNLMLLVVRLSQKKVSIRYVPLKLA